MCVTLDDTCSKKVHANKDTRGSNSGSWLKPIVQVHGQCSSSVDGGPATPWWEGKKVIYTYTHKCLQDLDPLYWQICGECILSCEYFPLLFSWFNWLWKSSQTAVAELFRQHTPCTYSEQRQPPFQSVDQMCIFLKCSYAADTFCLHRKWMQAWIQL